MNSLLARDRDDFHRLLNLAADYGAAYLDRLDTLPAATPCVNSQPALAMRCRPATGRVSGDLSQAGRRRRP